ncbi:hypothetical protein ACVWYQ_003285 [Bradyrhizobium sp. USDA 3397]
MSGYTASIITYHPDLGPRTGPTAIILEGLRIEGTGWPVALPEELGELDMVGEAQLTFPAHPPLNLRTHRETFCSCGYGNVHGKPPTVR